MVATIEQMASAGYYLESQRSFRHPNEYYTAGEEPDGTWFNPKGLFGLEDGAKVDSSQFQRLYNGFAPDGSGKLVQRAGNPDRSPGVDMTFSVDKSVSALWAIAEPEMRQRIEAMAVAAARAALEDTVLRHCSYTRMAAKGVTRPVEADLMGATFVHGTSRENDPQLHVHCTIFNLAHTHGDGKWRAHHQYPVYSWKKAAGALFRANMAWELQQGLGVRMEQYGPNAEFTRVVGMPDDLQSFWSKRRKAIVAKAGELGIPSLGNASRMAGVNKLTREGKSHDNDPEVRHRRWRGEAEGYVEREQLIAAVTGHKAEIGREETRELTDRLDDLPAHLAREEAVFRRPDMVEAAANAAAGLMGRDAVGTAIERLRRNPEIERLEPNKPTAESLAGMVHTEVYSTRHNLGLEQAVKDMAEAMAADSGHGLPEDAVRQKVETLLAQEYPLSQEQSLAIRHATMRGGRVAVIEGAAGSGKTTTLRPITDLHREHGYQIVPTAVAWRTAVALGDDCDARPYCVDKLLKLAARGQLEIGPKTLIVVDEAGMLSTRQAHHILQLSERHGAKVVFAGDTRQQQPVEAGPGLRLIRDVAGSIRVDRIRRQKADLEDVLTHVHGETPEQARFQAGLTSPQDRDAIIADYEAMEKKPVFTPWQVSVSEALRDGEAGQAIEAWRLRGRLHLCHDEEKTLTKLVEDWERHAKTEPDASTVVLARTRAEARALSWLMRERVLARTPEAERTVIEVSRDLDGRATEPLEIAVGDRLRIGATQWEKQLFNGTVVTVEGIEVRRTEDSAVTRKARNRRAGGRGSAADIDGSEPEHSRDESKAEPSVHITARTDDGRRVAFRHDEIRDWHDNIRLDYGYAMTIASAQGLTVDRAFLLVDDRPARETIYPAATRHREGIDVYVNRAPIVLDIADRRPEDEAERPVLDSDVRAYLAERWSRSEPKEAALDYTTDGMWRDAREGARADIGNGRDRPRSAEHGGPGERQGDADEARLSAVNDNFRARIARELRHAVNGWRHGAAVDAFAAERSAVLAQWDALRERTRAEGDAVALSPAFRETLDRHGALLRQADSFGARPRAYGRLLAERAGIGSGDLAELRALHERAQRHRQAAVMRRVRETRREAGWEALYDALQQDWSGLRAQADQLQTSMLPMDGYDALIGRVRDLARHPDLPAADREELTGLLDWHDRETHARGTAERWLTDAERHAEAYREMAREAGGKGIAVVDLPGLEAWREEARTLAATGETVLGDEDAYGAYLDAMPDGRERAARAAGQLHDGIGEGREPDWLSAWEPVIGEWNALMERARRSGGIAFYTEGYAELIPRLRELAGNPDIPAGERAPLVRILADRERHLEARKRIDDFLDATGRHGTRRADLQAAADGAGVALTQARGYRRWRGTAERLLKEGEAILADRICGPHLDRAGSVRRLAEERVSRLGEVIRKDDRELAEAEREAQREARERQRLAEETKGVQRRWAAEAPRLMFAADSGAGEAESARRAPAQAALSRLGHAAGRLFGGADYERWVREESLRRDVMERWKALRRDWNRQVERAVAEGVHVIDTDGCRRLRDALETLSRNMLLDRSIARQIGAVLSGLREPHAHAGYAESCHDRLRTGLQSRAALEPDAAVPDLADYDRWRNLIDDEIERCEEVLANPRHYGIHVHAMARRGESLASVLSRAREVLREDDRRLVETFAGRRKGEDEVLREDRIARLLDDPEKLGELRRQRAERRKSREAAEQRRKGRYRSRGIGM